MLKSKLQVLLALVTLFTTSTLFAQIDEKKMTALKKEEVKDEKEGWKSGGSFGLSLDQLALFNPRVGAGENRIGFGGIGTIFANKKDGKFTWGNNLTMQLGVQKIGENKWQKNIDAFRLGTKLGYQSKNPKLFYALLGTLETQLTPTYIGNYLSANNAGDFINSKFLAPAFIEIIPGIDYRHDSHLSILFSPIASKIILVADQDIANLNDNGKSLFGMELKDANVPGVYKTARYFFGASLAGRYTNKFLNDKILLNSRLDLFTNYLKDPQNIDVRFINDIGVAVFKKISINLILDYFYDNDVLVQKKDSNGKYTLLGNGGSLTEQLVVKYNTTF